MKQRIFLNEFAPLKIKKCIFKQLKKAWFIGIIIIEVIRMELSDFLTEYNKLSNVFQQIILKLLIDLSHTCENEKDLMALALKMIMIDNEVSHNNIISVIKEEEGLVEKGVDELDIRSAIRSVLKRYSKKSQYFKRVLELIGVDEAYVEKTAFSYRALYLNMLWGDEYIDTYPNYEGFLFDTLLQENKIPVFRLICNINNIDKYERTINELFAYDEPLPEDLNC